MYLLLQAVEDDDLVAALDEQRGDQVRADEPGASGDENPHACINRRIWGPPSQVDVGRLALRSLIVRVERRANYDDERAVPTPVESSPRCL